MRDDRRDVVMATQVNMWKGKFCIDYFFTKNVTLKTVYIVICLRCFFIDDLLGTTKLQRKVKVTHWYWSSSPLVTWPSPHRCQPPPSCDLRQMICFLILKSTPHKYDGSTGCFAQRQAPDTSLTLTRGCWSVVRDALRKLLRKDMKASCRQDLGSLARSLSSWAAPASWYQAAPPQSVFSTLSGCVHQPKWDGTGQERVPVPLSILRLHQRQPGSVQKPSRPVSSVTSIHRPPALVANCDRSSYGRSHWIASASFDRLY